MSGADFGAFVLALIVVVAVAAILVWLLNWLYLRSSKERAFVRTGLGGQKVVMNGGAFVLPIVHEVIPVNMNTLRLEVSRGRDKALITRDRMRVDVISEFYVRVQAKEDAIAAAAQTLGTRTMQPAELKELVEGKFVDALRTVAAEMTMEELHEKRGNYVKRVRETVASDLIQNGLELETVSLTQLDQTAMEFFNPSNAFDAEGLTRLTDQIEKRKKIRNDIEQDTMIQIRNKNLETEKQALEIDRELEYARLQQERELETTRAAQRAEVIREKAEREQEGERAQIGAREAIERARLVSDRALEEERIAKDRNLQQLEIERRKTIELAEQQRAIQVAAQSKAQSDAQAEADRARAGAAIEEERVFTARETEMAERRKRIELIQASQEAEREAIRIRLAAEAERAAATDRGEAMRAQAEAEADAERIRAVAARIRHEVEAEGSRLMNEAANTLTPESRMSMMRLRLIDKLDAIIREQVKPMERIEGIKILHVDGLGGGGGGGGSGGGSRGGRGDYDGGGGFADNIVNSALRYRAQGPLVDQLLREIGVSGGDVGAAANGLLAGIGAGVGAGVGAGLVENAGASGKDAPKSLGGPGAEGDDGTLATPLRSGGAGSR
ncbi:MAG: flotillin domain-containing protein [Lautropia sp.]